MGEECEISCSLAKSPTMFVSRPAKENAALFLKQFDKEAADPSAESADAHEKAMTNALMEANRFEQERLAAKAAREAKIKRIKLIFRCVVPLACGALGLVTNGFSGLWTGIFIGCIVNEVLIFLWKLFWNVPWC